MGRIVRGTLFVLLALAGCRSAEAQAQTQGFDANRDGRVSRQEFVAGRSARFTQIDNNRDGVVNVADFPRAAGRPRAAAKIDQLIAGADTNHDGSITLSELGTAGTPAFDRADRNHDGFIDQSEAAALRAALAARR